MCRASADGSEQIRNDLDEFQLLSASVYVVVIFLMVYVGHLKEKLQRDLFLQVPARPALCPL